MMKTTSPSPAPASSKVRREAVARAVEALLKWMRSKVKQRKAQLLEHDDLLYLVLTVKRIPPTGRINPHRIPLPHPLLTSNPSVCLIVDDRPRTPLSPSAARDLITLSSLPVSEVIALSDLRADYRPYEARRRLCDSHDLFFADRRLLHLLPRLLGKHFFEKKKTPLAVDLARKGWPEQIKAALASTFLYVRTGTCSGIKVGRVSQDADQIVDNIMAVIDGVAAYIPRKWANVRSLHIKSVDSLALPIYQAVPESGLKIAGLEIQGFKKTEAKEEEPLEGEVIQMEESEVEVVKSAEKKKMKKRGRIHEVSSADMLDRDDTKLGKDDLETDDLTEKAGAKKLKKKRVDVEKKTEKKGSKAKKEKPSEGEVEVEEAEVEVVKSAEKKKMKKRGRIHEVSFVDTLDCDDTKLGKDDLETDDLAEKAGAKKLKKKKVDVEKKTEKKGSKAKKEKPSEGETSNDDHIISPTDAKKKKKKKTLKVKQSKLRNSID